MPHIIHDNCTNCGACEPECPVGAIAETESARIIDEAACVDCGVCETICPVQAITAE